MKKELLVASLASCVVLTGGGIQVLAEDVEGATTSGTVKLISPAGEVTPLDPEETVAPEDGKETGNQGPLSIDYVPNFLFGEVEISGSTLTLPDLNSNPLVQVTDNRGSGAGWTLKLSATPFINNEDETKQLTGTTLSIGGITPEAVDETNTSTAPTPSAQTYGVSDTSAKTLLRAGADAGMGSWKGKFKTSDGANSVSLTIPAGNKIGSYTSTLTWSLANAPE
ncbi:WxL domain-containing protein [Listeria valentina]|uniref:WxL domain-containing protein n=1 Tax=Listeria valentina TaxID=2705293 RepID=UPI001FE5B7FA|nr:WxL domain-containing protein [Listeria valentina]